MRGAGAGAIGRAAGGAGMAGLPGAWAIAIERGPMTPASTTAVMLTYRICGSSLHIALETTCSEGSRSKCGNDLCAAAQYLALGVDLAQLGLEDLAVIVLRQRVDE